MSHLLDTCVLSEFRKKSPERNVINWLRHVSEEATFISAVTIGELQKGISRLPRSRRRGDLEVWLEAMMLRYDVRILGLDVPTFRKWGSLKAECEKRGRVLPMIDSLIAATALEHDLTLVTRNVSEFTGTGVRTLNIWEPAG